jgi:uncharacterized protein GlcG (DUF336 family)
MGLDGALALAQCALEIAETRSLAVCVTVVDPSGFAIVKLRADGADLLSVEISEAKARTAALTRMSTAVLATASAPGGPLAGLATYGGGRLVTLPGGEPVMGGNSVVAAIGIAGGAPDDDRALAVEAIASWSTAAKDRG